MASLRSTLRDLTNGVDRDAFDCARVIFNLIASGPRGADWGPGRFGRVRSDYCGMGTGREAFISVTWHKPGDLTVEFFGRGDSVDYSVDIPPYVHEQILTLIAAFDEAAIRVLAWRVATPYESHWEERLSRMCARLGFEF